MSRYRNTTNQPLVFDAAGHQIDAFGVAEVNASDPRTSRQIRERRLVLVPDPVEFIEPATPEPAEDTTAEADPAEDTTAEADPDPDPTPKPRKSRTRTNQKENER